MATATEEKPADATAPTSRRDVLLNVINQERHVVESWFNQNPDGPLPRHYWPCVRNLIATWAAEPPPAEFESLFNDVLEYARRTRDHLCRWGARYREAKPISPGGTDGVLWRGQQLEDAVARLKAAARPRQLESFAELVAQGVDDDQLSRMFNVERHVIEEARKNPESANLTQTPPRTLADQCIRGARWQEFLLTAAVVEKLFEDPLICRGDLAKIDPANSRMYLSNEFSGG